MRILALTFLLSAWPLMAQPAAPPDGVPVVVDGREVLRIRANLGPFTAAQRAAEVQKKIESLASELGLARREVNVVPFEDKALIMSGSVALLLVAPQDAAAEKTTVISLASRHAQQIRAAFRAYRTTHSFAAYLLAAGKAAGAWVLFALFWWLAFRGLRWAGGRIRDRFAREAQARRAVGFGREVWERGALAVLALLKVALAILFLFQVSFLLSYSFGLFPGTAGISTTLLDYLKTTFGMIGDAVLNYLPSGGVVLIVGFLTYNLLRLLKFLSNAVARGELHVRGLHPEMATPTYQFVRILVVLFALVVMFPYLPGGQSEAFKGVSIFIGVLISLGSGSSVGNLLAGVILTYMRPFRLGDRVKIADTLGDVLEKTLLVTRLRTIKNEEVVIPNSSILGNQIYNYSAMARNRGLILYSTVTIGYDAPWRKVHQLLIDAALATPGILPNPAPFVLETSLNDFHISYQINAYTDRPNEFEFTYSRLHENIQESFNRGGVEIMSPTFLALRDGNTVTTPETHRPRDYEPPGFRIKT